MEQARATAPRSSGRVLRATLNFGLGSYVPRLVNFALLPVYARYLAPAEMGVIEACMAVDLLMQSVARAGFPGALARHYFEWRTEEEHADLLVTLGLGAFVSSALVSALALLLGPPLFSRWLPEVPFHPYVELALLTSLFRVPAEIQQRMLQAREQSRVSALLNSAMSLVGSMSKVLLVAGMGWGILGALLAELFTGAVGAVVAVVNHRRELAVGRFRPQMFKSALAYGLPVVPHRFGAWLHEYANRWVMAYFGALGAVGELSVGARVVAPIQVAAGAFATAFSPIYFQLRRDLAPDDALREIGQVVRVTTGLSLVLAFGATSFGSLAIHWLLPSSYAGSASAVGFLAGAWVFRSLYNIQVLETLNAMNTRPLALIFSLGAGVTIGTTIVLVQRFGVAGAAFGQMAGTAVAALVAWRLARRSFPNPVDRRTTVVCVGGALGAGLMGLIPLPAGYGTGLMTALALFSLSAGTALVLLGVTPRRVQEFARKRKKRPERPVPAQPELR